MGKLNIFEISFANLSGVFYSGNYVEGHVTIELKERMKMRGIKMSFKGKAYVHWTEQRTVGSGDSRRTETVHYTSSEKYFDQDMLLFGIWASQGSDTEYLEMGRHTFPYRFQLPQGLPSSFEGDVGHIRYHVSCNIDKPWKFDHKTKRLFTVISILDLNSQPQYSQPCCGNKQKHLCCLCCKSGPITAQFRIDRQGWVPGEAIKLYADICNGANRTMEKSYVKLKMITSFHADGKTKQKTKEIACVKRPAIEEGEEDHWNGEHLVIPPLPPSKLLGCHIIDVDYILKLHVEPSGIATDLEIPFEIIIGTIPLMTVVQQAPPLAPPPIGFGQYGDVDPSVPPAGAQAPLPMPDVPNCPPPSYMECITGRVNARDEDDDEHTKGNLDFAPSYTYYNWGHTPTTISGEKE